MVNVAERVVVDVGVGVVEGVVDGVAVNDVGLVEGLVAVVVVVVVVIFAGSYVYSSVKRKKSFKSKKTIISFSAKIEEYTPMMLQLKCNILKLENLKKLNLQV